MRKLVFFFFLVSIFSCKTQKYDHLMDVDASYLYFNKEDKNIDQEVDEMIAPFRAELSAKMNVVLIKNEVELKKGRPNCNMGQWIADLLKEYCNRNDLGVDIAVQNYGGLRSNNVGTGDLTVGNIYEVMPFENFLVTMEVDGNLLKNFCDHICASGGWPISDGLEFTMNETSASNIMVNGKALELDKTYKIAIPDYIANGGSDCAFFKGKKHTSTGKLIRDIMIEDSKMRGEKGETLAIKTKKRIHG